MVTSRYVLIHPLDSKSPLLIHHSVSLAPLVVLRLPTKSSSTSPVSSSTFVKARAMWFPSSFRRWLLLPFGASCAMVHFKRKKPDSLPGIHFRLHQHSRANTNCVTGPRKFHNADRCIQRGRLWHVPHQEHRIGQEAIKACLDLI